ncbi:hypothetical protein H8F21_16045 [Pseudomonas sp. P66]|uniref:Uncharacterized protein n=1 Tax=Pseudomonas arcuscaelestis TaxID=2710591 RepID=A0ABS2C1H2_9PSED|nr:hypothetical protein [Pseudomonas arcuscaelestis]MBM5459081.1 hypothetical protein [Pseudomonas arcuscaelestis]
MIPVGVISGLRFTQEHPYVTGVVIAVLLALAILAASRSRRSPQRKNALRAVSLALVIGAAGFFSWAYNTRSPGLAEQVTKLAEQVSAQQAAKSDAVEPGAK